MTRKNSDDLDPTIQPGDRDGKISEGAMGGEGAKQTPPVEDWDRFTLSKFLGSGGMGRVFQGFDYRLNRQVAVKFLVGRNPERIARFVREARAQARVEHEHVCKVHEVGEVSGFPYIAMQHIDGLPLHLAAESMTLEEKLQTLRMVTEGVHEAHRVGLIHRDLKPANVMVERGDDGILKPFVLDFGLARFGSEIDLTLDGAVLGTPGYMAPEQVLGEIGKLDRRTDVYALGATLYHLLVGAPPFTGSSPGMVLKDIMEKEPDKPSQKVPSIPKDVETIALKCLEKRPERRYQSANALAEDLKRYLDGDPIQARPVNWRYRLVKKVRKNKTAFFFGGLASLLLLITFSWGLYTNWQASVREDLARELTAKVIEIESSARLSHMSPVHDIRPDQRRLLAQMERIQAGLDNRGRSGRGPGHYALGCGHFALNDLSAALGHLERAWAVGYREPRVAYALGLAYTELFREQLARIQLIQDKRARNERLTVLETQYRDPALTFMRRAKTMDDNASAYIEALIAYCENRFEDSLELLETSRQEQPWFYEAHRLEGDLYRDWARQMGDAGKVQEARVSFEKSLAAYEGAIQIAESDPRTYKQMSSALILMMHMEMFRKENLEPLLARGLLQTNRALEVLPDDGEAWRLRARLYRAMARNRRLVEDKQTAQYLKEAAEAAREATVSVGNTSLAFLELSMVYWEWARWLEYLKEDNGTLIQQALASLERVGDQDRDFLYFYTLGQAYKSKANRQVDLGENPCTSFQNSVAAFRRAIALQPHRIESYNSLANCFLAMTNFGSCPKTSTRQLQQETVRVLDQAIAINPKHPVLLYQSGRAYQRLARSDETRGWQLDDALAAKAIARYEAARGINDKLWFVYNSLGWACLLRAQNNWELGRDPESFYEEAARTFSQGQEAVPNSRMLHQNRAWIHYYRSKFRVRTGGDPSLELDAAFTHVNKALSLSRTTDGLLCLGSIFRIQAEWHLNRDEDPEPWLGRARKTFEEILTLDEKHAETFRSLGRLFTLEARWRLQQRRAPDMAFQRAEKVLARALALEPDSLFFHLAEGRYRLQVGLSARVNGARALPQVSLGLKAAERALELRPGYAEAQALKACLLRVQALHWENDPTTLTARAREGFQSAISANPFLRFEWSPLLLP